MTLVSTKKKKPIWTVGSQDFEDECEAKRVAEENDMDIVFTQNKVVTVYQYFDKDNHEYWTIDSVKASAEVTARLNERENCGKRLVEILGKVFKKEDSTNVYYRVPMGVIEKIDYFGKRERYIVFEDTRIFKDITNSYWATSPVKSIDSVNIVYIDDWFKDENLTTVEEMNKAITKGMNAYKKFIKDPKFIERRTEGVLVTSHYISKYGKKP